MIHLGVAFVFLWVGIFIGFTVGFKKCKKVDDEIIARINKKKLIS